MSQEHSGNTAMWLPHAKPRQASARGTQAWKQAELGSPNLLLPLGLSEEAAPGLSILLAPDPLLPGSCPAARMG